MRTPKGITECNYNMQLALKAVGIDGSFAEQLMMGESLNTVLEAIKNNHKIRQLTTSELPYSKLEIKKLDESIIIWLKILKIVNPDVKQILDVIHSVRNGVLLCDLVTVVFNSKISGVFRQPQTVSTQQQNIRKASDVLKRQANMSQKFTWSD